MHAHDGSKLSASLRTPQKMRSPRANQERRASQCYSLLPQLRWLFRRFRTFRVLEHAGFIAMVAEKAEVPES